jgi:REP element-mobilizing transposase RayT
MRWRNAVVEGLMRRARVGVFALLVWATWDRLPLLTEDIVRRVWRAVSSECAVLGVEVLSVGGVADHVHLLVRLPGP